MPVSEIRVRDGSGQVYKGSRERGELLLHLTARTAGREDAWLFVDGVWIDIGHDERPESVLCDWDVVEPLRRCAPGAEVVWYHVHPLQHDPTIVYPPSIEDILALVRLRGFCEEDWGVRLCGKVIDGHGIWRIDLVDELWQTLRSQDGSRSPGRLGAFDPRDTASLLTSAARKRELAWLAFYLEHEEISRGILDNQEGEHGLVVRRYIAAMAEIGLLLDYQPVGRSEDLPPNE
jgi:hypothetical protein